MRRCPVAAVWRCGPNGQASDAQASDAQASDARGAEMGVELLVPLRSELGSRSPLLCYDIVHSLNHLLQAGVVSLVLLEVEAGFLSLVGMSLLRGD